MSIKMLITEIETEIERELQDGFDHIEYGESYISGLEFAPKLLKLELRVTDDFPDLEGVQ